MWRSLIVFSCVLALVYCQHRPEILNLHVHKKKHHHGHHHHLLYHGLAYLTFWVIKLKVIFVLGTLFTFFLFAGKLVAILKYFDYTKHHHHEPEKIYIQAPSYEHHHSFSGGPPSFVESDYAPTGPEYHGRSIQSTSSLFNANSYEEFVRMLRKLNITDLAFESMKIISEECRRKFVCEADYSSSHSSILRATFDMLSDEAYAKYRTSRNYSVETLQDCDRLYPTCKSTVTS